ncbi:hypothetical protein MRB53_035753 [Persea americana]|uniref:Uncharacterized protein n=1 Tax=Persea americana TaxID=3435 RepID=A0ACC2K5I9_PERAE|nr:hypothetical protein MRB53_035753 [Persea americana]
MTRFIVSLIFLLLLSLSGGPEAFVDAQKQTYHVPVANVRRLKIQNAFLNDYGAEPNPRHNPLSPPPPGGAYNNP